MLTGRPFVDDLDQGLLLLVFPIEPSQVVVKTSSPSMARATVLHSRDEHAAFPQSVVEP